jgi:acid phosphatase
MDYLNKLWSKWMPARSPRVAVDGHPRLSGIMDSVNATLAHGPATRLPSEFYDEKGREIMDKIAVEEWFAGYKENSEYRRLGSGGLMGDIVDRMVSTAVGGGWRVPSLPARVEQPPPAIKFALSGCHDTTLAGLVASMGAFENEKWPPYTSSVAIELFSTTADHQNQSNDRSGAGNVLEESSTKNPSSSQQNQGSGLFSFLKNPFSSSSNSSKPASSSSVTTRTLLSDMPESTRNQLRQYYVRVRYNDRPMRIPGCVARTSNHLPGDDSFCTLEAFKEIADKFTPKNWKVECTENLGEGIFGKDDKDKGVAGY